MTDDEITERVARALAAYKMALVGDPQGLRLPDDLWLKCAVEARVAIKALQACEAGDEE